jgi:uncharacterized secreted protein with C-terminal beta-propeller domain
MTNQNLYFKLNHKVIELQKSVDALAAREDLSGQIRQKLAILHEHWQKSSGKFNEISEPIDNLLLAKYNTERVLTILTDYRDLDSDVERNK